MLHHSRLRFAAAGRELSRNEKQFPISNSGQQSVPTLSGRDRDHRSCDDRTGCSTIPASALLLRAGSYRGITSLKKPITADELYLNIFANLPKVKLRIKISCVDFPSISGYIDAENIFIY
jgi:hypothetical protein